MTTETTGQDLERLEAALDRFGADLARWPDAERGWAEALAGATPAARRLIDQARFAEAALDALPTPRPDATLVGSILAASPAGTGALASRPWPFRTFWKPMAGLAFALMLGLATGVLAPDYGSQTQTITTAEVIEIATDGTVGFGLGDE